MSTTNCLDQIANIDIYLLDEIIKGRYNKTDKILDAGCGSGRNLKWFYENSYTFFAVDNDAERLEKAKELYPNKKENFSVSNVESLPFTSESFQHIICNAVLHFAKNTGHFEVMFSELVRVLKPNGTLFIRMTSDIGIEKIVKTTSNGVCKLPDLTERFLLNRTLLKNIMETNNLSFLVPLKTVNVNDLRAMTTLVLLKN
jgi:ubiquinone/menaquinone biosynthesis C-methylase UbiE